MCQMCYFRHWDIVKKKGGKKIPTIMKLHSNSSRRKKDKLIYNMSSGNNWYEEK